MHKLILSLWFLCFSTLNYASVTNYYQSLRHHPAALYTFLKNMPKGGELHYHYDGSVYAEAMLQIAQKQDVCLEPHSLSAQTCHPSHQTLTAKQVLMQTSLLTRIIHAWSMHQFFPKKETAHHHFFAVFPKVGYLYAKFKQELLASILQKAAKQHELYLEIIAFGMDGDSYAALIAKEKSYEKKRDILLANSDFQREINQMVAASESFLPAAHSVLHCEQSPAQAACQIQVNFQTYVRRVKSLDAVFAQALAGFVATERSKTIVGVNLVDMETHPTAQHDYQTQMYIYGLLHHWYPKVHIALHAGELYPKSIRSHQVISPIRDAIQIGHAERIGHGLDIREEPNPEALTALMTKKAIAVEVNLTSNHTLFGVHGAQHPLKFYLAQHVPIVLSTDDEGILRTDLTREYWIAAREQALDYPTLKQINRNTLTYAFIPGQSIWTDPEHAILTPACRSLNSKLCQQFIANNPKAKLQWQLEQRLNTFEATYALKPMNSHQS